MTQETEKKRPALNVFVTVPNGYGDNTRIGAQIGVAFKHGEGDGFNIILDAQPMPSIFTGQIELVAFAPKS